MKINFEQVEVFTDVAHTQCVRRDIKRDFANVIYMTGAGLPAHALALKIYNSEGETEYSPEECSIIREVANQCNPNIIDAINGLLSKPQPR